MAKKSKAISKNQIVAFSAFITLILTAILWLLYGFGLLGGAAMALLFIKDLFLLFTIALAAHNFAKGLGQTWYIIYWVIVVLAIFGLIFSSFFKL
ncbi:MAG: hypothetical protein LBF12_07340 [Christensenellaceae bacterium]|jgi:hypothetical protein|nr:hypothetical protein [Christensenellaceae bacterium]